MWRSIGAGLAGVVVAVVLVMAIEAIGHLIYPPPAGMGTDRERIKEYLPTASPLVVVFVLLAWVAGAIGGTVTATLLDPKRSVIHACVVGGLILTGSVINLVMIPHPLWFTLLAPVAVVAAAVGSRLKAKPT